MDEVTGLEVENVYRVSTRRQQDPDVISYPFKLQNEPLEMVLQFGDGTEEVVHYKKGVLPTKLPIVP